MEDFRMEDYKQLLATVLPTVSKYITDSYIVKGEVIIELKSGTTKSDVLATVPAPVQIERVGNQIMGLRINPTHAEVNFQTLKERHGF